jgi:GABA(A) receptor-associated protein
MASFKIQKSFKERLNESKRIMDKYQDRIPVICEKSANKSADLPSLDKTKYLVPNDLTIGQFMYVIRSRLKLPSDKALFLIIDGVFPSSTMIIKDAYKEHKDIDGFLYVKYCQENTFG